MTSSGYAREGVFWVPRGARWDELAAQAQVPTSAS